MEKQEETITSTSAEAFKEANLTGTTASSEGPEASAKEVKDATKELNPDKNSMDSRG